MKQKSSCQTLLANIEISLNSNHHGWYLSNHCQIDSTANLRVSPRAEMRDDEIHIDFRSLETCFSG